MEQLHYHEVEHQHRIKSEAKYRDYIRMMQAGCGSGLPAKPGAERFLHVLRKTRRTDDLDRHVAPKHFIARPIHYSHSPATQERANTVLPGNNPPYKGVSWIRHALSGDVQTCAPVDFPSLLLRAYLGPLRWCPLQHSARNRACSRTYFITTFFSPLLSTAPVAVANPLPS